MRRWGAAAVVVGLVAWLCVPASTAPPENPHGYMDQEANCGGCHRMEPDGDDWLLDAHIFTRSVVEICKECHPDGEIGRSHPVDVDPYRELGLSDLPDTLPLQLVEGERDELMTCGTCHNPHLPRFSPKKLYKRQRPFPGKAKRFLTYFLRVRPDDPRDGFAPLCKSCHPKM
ncbi:MULTISPECIES: hypothetical protein [Deferrisoma]